MKQIGKKIVKKILELLNSLVKEDEEDEDEDDEDNEKKKDEKKKKDEDEDDFEEKDKEKKEKKSGKEKKYNKFWKEFGKNIKLGIVEDPANRGKLAKLTRWYSSKNQTELTSLQEYIDRAKPNQDSIFFLAGESKAQIMKQPEIQGFLKRGYEVLLLEDPIDEFCFQHLNEFEKKKLVNIGKGDVKLPEDDEATRKRNKKLKKMYEPLTTWWKEVFPDVLEKV